MPAVPKMIPKPTVLSWTLHARAKMGFYKLSQARVRRVLHSPKRVEEGVAPKTVAMMQPAALTGQGFRAARSFHAGTGTGAGNTRKEEKWTQEIWVMVQDAGAHRKVISAWRYPGVTKPRSAAAMDVLRREFGEFAKSGET